MTLNNQIIEIIKKNCDIYQNKVALADNNQSINYKEFKNKIEDLTSILIKSGVSKSSRVVFIIPNSVDFVIIHFAILNCSAVSVPLEHDIKEKNFIQILESTEPDVIIIDSKNIQNYDLSDFKYSTFIKWSLEKESLKDKIYFYNIAKTNKNLAKIENDLAVILFTSGTTSSPKGVMITNRNIIETQKNIINFCSYNNQSFEVITLPLSHSFGLGQVYAMLFSGGGAFIHRGLTKIKKVFESIKEHKASGFPSTPSGLTLILNNYADYFKNSGKSLKNMVINSAPMPVDLTKKLKLFLPKVDILFYYGLTEASRSTFINLSLEEGKNLSSVGKPMNGVEIELSKAKSEILISGINLSPGYWNSKSTTQKSFIKGKLYTGDIGRFDKHNNLFIIGRIKDQINVGGLKVNPIELENLIGSKTSVNKIAICGRTIENHDEEVIAIVVAENKKNSTNEINQICKSELEFYKRPKEIIFVKKIPTKTNGKIDRLKLKELYLKKKE